MTAAPWSTLKDDSEREKVKSPFPRVFVELEKERKKRKGVSQRFKGSRIEKVDI